MFGHCVIFKQNSNINKLHINKNKKNINVINKQLDFKNSFYLNVNFNFNIK